MLFSVTAYGFAIAPAVGQAVANLINGQNTTELEGLNPARITRIQPSQLEQFMNAPHNSNILPES